MPRTSIARLMALVLLIAVELAAATAGAFTFAVVTLSAATLGAVLARGPLRAFFLGCASFGWASMLLTFGTGQNFRNQLPTVQPIVRAYEAINGPWPTTFRSPDEAARFVTQLVLGVNRAITIGHSLIALTLALVGGAVLGMIAGRRRHRELGLVRSLES